MQKWFTNFLSWIFPSTKAVQAIEAMSPADFHASARRVIDELPQGIHSMFAYKDSLVRQALWAVKYDGNQIIARLFGLLLYDEMIEILSEEKLFNNFENPIVIPLPLSSKRRQERGWNQSELIGQEVAKLSSEWQYDQNILLKIRHTLPQTKLRREERLKNLKGCFAVSKNTISKISGRNIILIDDVTTTGSTIIEARRTLLAAGARQVLAFTVAH